MGFHAPKVQTPTPLPPPPTPATAYSAPKPVERPNLGGTFLTGGALGDPTTKQRKTLLGQ